MKYTKEKLEELVSESLCVWDVVEKTGMSKQAGNYRYIKSRIDKYGISTIHFENQMKKGSGKEKPLSEWLVKDKFLTTNGNSLKQKLYKAGLKQPICEICGQDEYWMGNKISLILDHVDGDRENNTIENLRIVCPNCNAGLPTHCGKNRKKVLKIKEHKPSNKWVGNKNKEEIKNKILESKMDFSKYGWGVKLGKILNKTPQYIMKFVKINIPELYMVCFKQK